MTRSTFFLAAFFLFGALSSAPVVADKEAGGYLLVRINGINNEATASIDLTNIESDEVVRIRSRKCTAVDRRSRLCLLPAPEGRYFWSRFELAFKLRKEVSRIDGPSIRRSGPSGSDDTLEIVSDAISYIGDWELLHTEEWNSSSPRGRISVDIRQDPATLKLLYEYFPDDAAKYDLFLSMRGKKAISLQDFLAIVEQQSK